MGTSNLDQAPSQLSILWDQSFCPDTRGHLSLMTSTTHEVSGEVQQGQVGGYGGWALSSVPLILLHLGRQSLVHAA